MPDISEYFPGLKDGTVTLGNIQVADLGDILDANGNEILEFDTVASAVNHIGVVNAATGNNPQIQAKGESDTGITFATDDDEEILILNGVASAVNEITIGSAATGANPTIAASGEADTGITFNNDQAEEILILDSIASAVNEITIANAATGNNPLIQATGEADTGITFMNDQSEEILILDSNATAVNEVTIDNSAAGSPVIISATGGDTDIDLQLLAKGAGSIDASTDGIRTIQSVNNVNDTTPTNAELDTAFGSATGRGFIGTIDDNDDDTVSYIAWSTDASWFWVIGTKAA
jgi:hypothetical protein